MKTRTILVGLACMCSAALIARSTLAQDSGSAAKDAAKAAADEAKKQLQGAGQQAAEDAKKKVGEWAGHGDKAMSADEQRQMEAMMKMGQPGPEHEYLKALEGRWTAACKNRMSPDAPWEETKGVMTNRMVMGGRWLQQDYTGEMMGHPFTGMGYLGYDNMQKKYVATWMDTMCTGMMVCYGTADSAHKTYTFTGEMLDPMTGKMTKFKNILTMQGADKHSFQMICTGPDGKEFTCMEINYTKS
jgi:hypothetical protein